jgi:signal transduction histidine kinase
MLASRKADAALVTVGLCAAAMGVATRHVAGVEAVADLVFGAVVATSLLLVVRLLVNAFLGAWRQHRAARALIRRPTIDAARQAVASERARLAADIEAVVRRSLQSMRRHVEQALRVDNAVEPIQEIQHLGRSATAELRRLLGLLREAEACPPEPEPVLRRFVGWRTDVAMAGAVVVLAVTEHYVENAIDGWPVPGSHSLMSVAFTVVAAATLVWRRRTPAVAAAVCGLVLFTAAAVGRPTSTGFWVIAGPAVLAYATMRRLTWLDTCAAVVLLAAVAAAVAWRDPQNMPISVQTVLVGGVAGLLVALANRRRAADQAAAAQRSAELTRAAIEAVRAERLTVAREVHDLVSHAIGVMVVQAAAAELLLPTDRRRAQAALSVVRSVADDALAELDALVHVIGAGALGGPSRDAAATASFVPGQPATSPYVVAGPASDLAALVQRMRGAGLTVRLDVQGTIASHTAATVYRIVQEGLTNVLRHAPGAAVAVRVANGPDDVHVEVHDDGPGPSGPTRHGYGLAGIAERVQRLGGTLRTGRAGRGNGFRIDVRLPASPPP